MPQRPRRGLTLLEMMLALTVFAVGTVAAAELLQQAQTCSIDGEQTLLAAYRAQECLETTRNLSYSQLGTVTFSSVSGCGSSLSDLPSGTREVTVATPYTNLRQVTVTVSWAAKGGTTNVALQTYRSNI